MKRKLYLIHHKNLSKGVESFAESLINKIDQSKWEVKKLEFNPLGINLYDKNNNIYRLKKDDFNIFINPAPAWLINKKSIIIIHDLISLEFPFSKSYFKYIKSRIKYIFYFISWKIYKNELNFICISKSTENKLKEVLNKFFKIKKYNSAFGYQSIRSLHLEANESSPILDRVIQREYNWISFYDINLHKNPKIVERILNHSIKQKINFAIITSKNNYFELNKKIKYIELPNYIFLNPEDYLLKNIYFKSHYLIYPSTVEGFGLPIIEGINYGLIPLIYPSKINMEIFGKNYKFYFENYNTLKNLILKTPSNKDIRYLSELKVRLLEKFQKKSIYKILNNKLK